MWLSAKRSEHETSHFVASPNPFPDSSRQGEVLQSNSKDTRPQTGKQEVHSQSAIAGALVMQSAAAQQLQSVRIEQ